MFDSNSFLKTVTAHPGVYCMLDRKGETLYVGKAKNLKKRLSSYFRGSVETKVQNLVNQIADIEVTVTRSEKEALLLENSLIKYLDPKYNVILKDDKSYPYLFLSQHTFPRLIYHRGPQTGKGEYFGPYSSAQAVRETLNFLQKTFKLRHCNDNFFNHRSRPCLQYQIKRCSAPCVNYISKDEYYEEVENVRQFLKGKLGVVHDELIQKMEKASNELKYEEAAFLRDKIRNLHQVQERQSVVAEKGQADVLAIVRVAEQVCIAKLMIRGGTMLGAKTYFPKTGLETDLASILQSFITQYYVSTHMQVDFPDELIINQVIPDKFLIQEVLSELTQADIQVKDAVRSKRAEWLQLATENAKQALKTRLASKAQQGKRLQNLEQCLGLEINRFECVDVSHTMGEATVVSAVVFDRNGPVKSAYRRYNVTVNTGDDYAALAEAVFRRFSKLQADEGALPDVLFIDGGKGQLNRVRVVLEECQVTELVLVAIAKGVARKPGLETLFILQPEALEPLEVHLPPTSPALHLIQAIRDEAHRFAITGHRQQRAKKRQQSPLEAIPGVGPKRRQHLLNHFGGQQGLMSASVDAISEVSGISRALAQKIYTALHAT